ncbi:MAG: methyltransferase domain-containing protein [Oscillospiraceae bacterium]|nr:methyltransferase domain-containing protein [Oscillospiraceae bacterium]
MNIANYKEYMTAEILMGPNSARILRELLEKYPLQRNSENKVLDLGCGKGLTSLILARETGAKIYANDLWIPAEDNAKRFNEWGIGEQITPVHKDANELEFDKGQFSSLVSIDSYHYFATKKCFFEEKILPFLSDKAVVLIGIPGIKDEYTGRSEELLPEWLGNEACMFKSPTEWKEIIGRHDRIEKIETWEMDCFDLAWKDWLSTENEYALGDRQFFETVIKPYTCFVGIYIKIK